MKNELQTENQNTKLEIINQVPEELLWMALVHESTNFHKSATLPFI